MPKDLPEIRNRIAQAPGPPVRRSERAETAPDQRPALIVDERRASRVLRVTAQGSNRAPPGNQGLFTVMSPNGNTWGSRFTVNRGLGYASGARFTVTRGSGYA